MKTKPKKQLGTLLSLGMGVLFVFFIGVVGFYSVIFHDGLSVRSGEWSDFGSYFGGLLGPGISFVTLLALLRTIGLQLEQNASFAAEGAQSNVLEYKSCQLRLLDQQITMFEKMLDRYDDEGRKLFELPAAPGASRMEALKRIDRNIQTTDAQVEMLIRLSVEISITEFESTEEIREKMKSALAFINPHIYKF